MEKLYSVTALILHPRDWKILTVSRKTNPEDLGLPGGKLENGESPEIALVREVKEETGLSILALTPIFEDLDRVEGGEPRPCRCYYVTAWSGVLKTEEDGVVDWKNPSDLLSQKCSFREYNQKLFDRMNEIGLMELVSDSQSSEAKG